MNFKLLDRYIFKQVLTATIAGVLLFIIVWISPEILFKIIRRLINGDISFLLAVKLFFLEIPEIISKAVPVGLMLGSLFVFDRLSRDSELTIMRMAGVNTFRLVVPIIFLGIIGMFVCFFIHKDIIPYTTLEIKTLKQDINQQHFVYIDKKENDQPKQILIVGGFNGHHIYDLKLLRFSEEVNTEDPLMESIITASHAEVHYDHWKLIGVVKYEIAPNGVYKEIQHLKEIEIFDAEAAKEAEQLLIYSTKRPREMNNPDLETYIALLKKLEMSEEHGFVLSKYYQRYSRSFGCIFLGICGVLLGISRPREKRFIGFTLGAALIFLYYIMIPFLDMLAQRGTLFPSIAAWFPDLIILAAIIALIKFKNV